jgi:hypothetical protein
MSNYAGNGYGPGVVVSNPGEYAGAPRGPASQADLQNFIKWQQQQIDPMQQGVVGDTWARQGITDPYNDPRLLAQAQEQIDRGNRRTDLYAANGINTPENIAPWSNPNWQADLNAQRQAQAERDAYLAEQSRLAGLVVGPGY